MMKPCAFLVTVSAAIACACTSQTAEQRDTSASETRPPPQSIARAEGAEGAGGAGGAGGAVNITRMAFIVGGTFSMGHVTAKPGMYGEEWKSNELPEHAVTLRAFYIDRDEVTVAEYTAFANAALHVARVDPHQPITFEGSDFHARPGSEDLPITFVTWLDAYAYCVTVGKSLPTEAEWERAARGPQQQGEGDQHRFPWGNDGPTCTKAVFMPGTQCELVPAKVGSRSPAGDSPEGVHDLAGNVAEWIADWYGPYDPSPAVDPTGPESGTERVLRGGSVVDPPAAIRTTARSGAAPFDRAESVGFRCVYRP